jgi:MarR family transcriptional regulator, transcriptional regulator for hemolysin
MSRNPAFRREIMFQINDVARAMRTYVDQRAREHGMTRAQWGALLRLERHEGMTQAEMAESLEIQPISAARLLDRLSGQGLVERRPHPSDRRANRLFLTPKGRATLESFVPLGRQISARMLGSLSEAETSQFLDILMRIRGNIRQASAANRGEDEADGGRRSASGVGHAG